MMTEDNRRFRDKVAFITGGGTGIGRAAALAFAREDASMAVVGRTLEELGETVHLIEQQGRRGVAITCDVTKCDEAQAAVERPSKCLVAWTSASTMLARAAYRAARRRHGGRVGSSPRRDLRGVLLCMKYQISQMLRQGGGPRLCGH